jgi:pyrroline-5-carboxylate reductase
MSRRLAVIGCGNIGQAIVRGLLAARWTTPDRVTVTNAHAATARAVAKELGVKGTKDNVKATHDADVILLGVKPQVIMSALTDLQGHVRPDQLVISIAAGISTRFIEQYTGQVPVVRCMPNLGVTVGAGAAAIAAGSRAAKAHVALARRVFEAVGTVEEVDESLMDAVTGLSGTGPMYVFYMIEAMSDAGVKMGLARDVATRLSQQTVLGSAMLAQAAHMHPAALKDLVSSPGGTSITALHVLRKQGFAAILMDAVEAATRRSAELGQ